MMVLVLADLVVLTHFLFIVFVVLGGLLGLRWKFVIWIHLPAMVWGVATEFFGIVCPLTYLENYLRDLGGAASYDASFIEEYLVPIVYPTALTREIQLWLGGALIAFNAVVYAFLWRHFRAPR